MLSKEVQIHSQLKYSSAVKLVVTQELPVFTASITDYSSNSFFQSEHFVVHYAKRFNSGCLVECLSVPSIKGSYLNVSMFCSGMISMQIKIAKLHKKLNSI